MCTRLIVNITQVYVPMYTLETLSLDKVNNFFSVYKSSGLKGVKINTLISLLLY